MKRQATKTKMENKMNSKKSVKEMQNGLKSEALRGMQNEGPMTKTDLTNLSLHQITEGLVSLSEALLKLYALQAQQAAKPDKFTRKATARRRLLSKSRGVQHKAQNEAQSHIDEQNQLAGQYSQLEPSLAPAAPLAVAVPQPAEHIDMAEQLEAPIELSTRRRKKRSTKGWTEDKRKAAQIRMKAYWMGRRFNK
jgi:hypothetical protein